jgi:hypothetical protein
MRKPSLVPGPDAYKLRVSFSLLDRTITNYQNPKQYCNHSDHLAGETNTNTAKNKFSLSKEDVLNI